MPIHWLIVITVYRLRTSPVYQLRVVAIYRLRVVAIYRLRVQIKSIVVDLERIC